MCFSPFWRAWYSRWILCEVDLLKAIKFSFSLRGALPKATAFASWNPCMLWWSGVGWFTAIHIFPVSQPVLNKMAITLHNIFYNTAAFKVHKLHSRTRTSHLCTTIFKVNCCCMAHIGTNPTCVAIAVIVFLQVDKTSRRKKGIRQQKGCRKTIMMVLGMLPPIVLNDGEPHPNFQDEMRIGF